MDDLISRQAAIDALDEQITLCDKALGSFDISMKDEYAVKVERSSLKVYRETLNILPSAQPETSHSEIPNNSDTISRQALIAYCDEKWIPLNVDAVNAQPTIIHCSECRHADWRFPGNGLAYCYCMAHSRGGLKGDDYCSYGEREATE